MGWTEEIKLPASFCYAGTERSSAGSAEAERPGTNNNSNQGRVREPPGLLVDAGVRVPLIGGFFIGTN